MDLLPKSFTIDIVKLDRRLVAITSENYNGLIKKNNDVFEVAWKSEPSSQDLMIVEQYWKNLTEELYNSPTAEEQVEKLAKMVADAKQFGAALTGQFALENIAMGITQAGKTRAVADYCYKLQYYLSTGSLYAAIEEINDRVVDIPPELSPFVTESRLIMYLNKIKVYLKIPTQ